MSAGNERERWQRRAPLWRVRCLKCGLSQPWGKYGIRIGAASWKKCTIGWCSRCRGLHCHMIEKAPAD
jgi:hypothetical protein